MAGAKLGVLYDDATFSALEIAEAAHGVCEVVWVVGWSQIEHPLPLTLLARLGPVVDVRGRTIEDVVGTLSQLSVGGLITFTDEPLRLAAELACRLDVAFHTPRTAELLTDKFSQRCALRDAGLPTPRFATIPPDIVEPAACHIDVGFPAIVKPREGSGSRDLRRIDTRAELLQFLHEPWVEDFLMEEFLADPPRRPQDLGAAMVSVETVVTGGRIRHLMITGRFPQDPPLHDTGGFMPSDVAPADASAVLEMATAATEALGITRGVLHTEIKLTPDGPRVVEVNGRVGGGVPVMMTRIGGPDLLALAMRIALGDDVDDVGRIDSDVPVSYFLWLHGPDRPFTLEHVSGLEDVRDRHGISAARLNHAQGDHVEPRAGNSAHIVAFEGVVESHFALSCLVRELAAEVSIAVDDRRPLTC